MLRRRGDRRRGRLARLAWVVPVLLAAASACVWPSPGFDAANTGYNPFEQAIDVVDVPTLVPAWRAGSHGPDGAESVRPVVGGGLVYTAAKNPFAVQAFDAAGARGCSGVPKVCDALWSGPTHGGVSRLVVAGDTLYAGTGADLLHAFDADGVEGCAGSPTTCSPLWTAPNVLASSIAVSGGRVYATDREGDTLVVFDAAGEEGCSGTPRVCTPLWSAAGGLPAVANGIVYTSRGGDVRAFDARGVQGCSGVPTTCAPLWRAHEPAGSSTVPTVAQGLVFVGTLTGDEMSWDGNLIGFDAAGVQGCSGVPKRCVPIWEAPTDGVTAPPAVAGDRLFVTGTFADLFAEVGRERLTVFDVDACSTTRPPCQPLWTAQVSPWASPVVANGVVYVVPGSTGFAAFDAAGNVNCAGPAPRTCQPLVAWATDVDRSPPVIADGVVYLVDDVLRAYELPPTPARAGAAP